jgi:hypothetical protein
MKGGREMSCQLNDRVLLLQQVRLFAACTIGSLVIGVGIARADGRYEVSLQRVDSSCYASCDLSGVAANDHDSEGYGLFDEDFGATSAFAENEPGPGGFVTDPWAEFSGDDYSVAAIQGSSASNKHIVEGTPDDEVGNEPGAGAYLEDNRYGSVDAHWKIDPNVDIDSTWIESTIQIVNESGKDAGDPCDIYWSATSSGRIVVGSSDISFECNTDGSVDISGTVYEGGSPVDVTGTYYGTVITFNAVEFIRPDVEFVMHVDRTALIDMGALQQCSRKVLGLTDGGWASATLRAYKDTTD